MSNIVILQGSPRKNSHTARLVQAFVRSCAPHHTVTCISVPELHINCCLGCNACLTSPGNHCCQQDDMTKIRPALAEADVLAVASPGYFCGISALLKTLLDRLLTPLRNSFKILRTALLIVGATSLPELFDSNLAQYRLLLSVFHLEDLVAALVRNLNNPGDFDGRPELQAARELADHFIK